MTHRTVKEVKSKQFSDRRLPIKNGRTYSGIASEARFARLSCAIVEVYRAASFSFQNDHHVTAVQNERQPRNTATIRPEALVEMDQERALREAAVAVGVFG